MIKRVEGAIPTAGLAVAKLTGIQVSQLVDVYCQLAGVTIQDVRDALKTVKITLHVRSGNTKYQVPANHVFEFNVDNPKESTKHNGEVCSVGVTLVSDLDSTRIFKCGLKDAINFALLLP